MNLPTSDEVTERCQTLFDKLIKDQKIHLAAMFMVFRGQEPIGLISCNRHAALSPLVEKFQIEQEGSFYHQQTDTKISVGGKIYIYCGDGVSCKHGIPLHCTGCGLCLEESLDVWRRHHHLPNGLFHNPGGYDLINLVRRWNVTNPRLILSLIEPDYPWDQIFFYDEYVYTNGQRRSNKITQEQIIEYDPKQVYTGWSQSSH